MLTRVTMNAQYQTKLNESAMESKKTNELASAKTDMAIKGMIQTNAIELEKEKMKMNNQNKKPIQGNKITGVYNKRILNGEIIGKQ